MVKPAKLELPYNFSCHDAAVWLCFSYDDDAALLTADRTAAEVIALNAADGWMAADGLNARTNLAIDVIGQIIA